MNTSPRIAVVGAGAIGGYFAGVLARAGYWVGLVARGRSLQAIARDGLHIESPRGNFVVTPAQVTDDANEIGAVDAVILGVKAWQVSETAQGMRPLLGATTKVLPLQNGVEAPAQLERVIGHEHTLVGLCRIITSVTAPGRVRDGGLEPSIALGEIDGSPLSPTAIALAQALREAGAVVQAPKDIHSALWEKLLFIAAVSGTGAVARSNIGEIRETPQTSGLLKQLMEETAAVAHARGIRMAPDVVSRTLSFVQTIPASGTASMQRDIAEGKPSELEAIIGAVARFGDASGIATPAMDFVYASLLPQERRARIRQGITENS
ncbi:MAG TPA: 2-dehydropantoate 2-reductase [Terriglobales bacterium]|jgi:2-dehydropantoate 2-reductase|nr:2-dehydropantoate 2-reductase [Terriglobales bacterium]